MVNFTRDFESIKSSLTKVEEYNKTCIESGLTGIGSVIAEEWSTLTPCQVKFTPCHVKFTPCPVKLIPCQVKFTPCHVNFTQHILSHRDWQAGYCICKTLSCL